MVAEVNQRRPVFDVVRPPTSRGTAWAWAREDLDGASVDRARPELAALFTGQTGPRRLLVYLGPDCFVDQQGLRLLLDLAAQARRCDGSLAVVAPPRCLVELVFLLSLEETLPTVTSMRRVACAVRTGTKGKR